jgi:hypothetical protein
MVIDGAASIRELNKSLGWHLPSDGPKTLNGLVTEALETIPERGMPEDRPLSPGNPRDRGQPREQGADLAYQPRAGRRIAPLTPICCDGQVIPLLYRQPLPIIPRLTRAAPDPLPPH